MMRYLLLLLACSFCGGVLLDSRSASGQNATEMETDWGAKTPKTHLLHYSCPEYWQRFFEQVGLPEAQAVDKARQFAASAQAFAESRTAITQRYHERCRRIGSNKSIDSRVRTQLMREELRPRWAEENENYRTTLVSWRNLLDDNRHQRAVYRDFVRGLRGLMRISLVRAESSTSPSKPFTIERHTNLIKLCDEMIARSHAEDRPDDQQVPKDTLSSPPQMAPAPPKPPAFAPPTVPEPALPKKTVGDALWDYWDLAMKGQKPEQSLEAYIESVTGVKSPETHHLFMEDPPPGTPPYDGIPGTVPEDWDVVQKEMPPFLQQSQKYGELLEAYLAGQPELPAWWNEAGFQKATQPLAMVSNAVADHLFVVPEEEQGETPGMEQVDAQLKAVFDPEFDPELAGEALDIVANTAAVLAFLSDDPKLHELSQQAGMTSAVIGEMVEAAQTVKTAKHLADQGRPDAAVLYTGLKTMAKVVKLFDFLAAGAVSKTMDAGADVLVAGTDAVDKFVYGRTGGEFGPWQNKEVHAFLTAQGGAGANRFDVTLQDGSKKKIEAFTLQRLVIDGQTYYMPLNANGNPQGVLLKHERPWYSIFSLGEMTVYHAGIERDGERVTINDVQKLDTVELTR